jgi:hypothetical protein
MRMRLAQIEITTRKASFPEPGAPALTDAVWALVRPEDAVEHIAVRLRPQLILLGVFIKTADREWSRTTALALARRVCATSPALRDWAVSQAHDVALTDVVPPTQAEEGRR